jgi:hypothetical protein
MSSTPSGKEMANMGKKIVMAAKRDLHVQGLPDGYGMDLGCIIELMIAEFEQEPVSIERARRGNGTLVAKKWEVGAERALSQQQNSGRLQPKYLISIKADSRQMTQAPATHQTEGCALLIPEGWVGELHCQSVYRNKTIFIYSGKDSRDMIAQNGNPTFKSMGELEKGGIVYDTVECSYYGVATELAKRDDVRFDEIRRKFVKTTRGEDGVDKESDLDRYIKVDLEFILVCDMAAMMSITQTGGGHDKEKCFCTNCFEKKGERDTPFAMTTTDVEMSLADLARAHGMKCETVLALNGGPFRGGLASEGLNAEYLASMTSAQGEDSSLESEGTANGQGAVKSKKARKRANKAATRSVWETAPGEAAPRKRKRATKASAAPSTIEACVPSASGSLLARQIEEWKDHIKEHKWEACILPSGSTVRTVRRRPADRKSDFLDALWLSDAAHRPPCTLHADMRLSEGILAGIFRKAHKIGHLRISELNKALFRYAEIKDKFKRVEDTKSYKKLGLQGPECEQLRALKEVNGITKIALVWVVECVFHDDLPFVKACSALVEQYKVVAENMRCKRAETVGLANLEEEAADLLVLWAATFDVGGLKKYYLHSLVHHFGCIQRYWVDRGYCIGMFENGGFEARHIVSRRGHKKCMDGHLNHKGCPHPAVMGTLEWVLKWQHGGALAAVNKARQELGHKFGWSFSEMREQSEKILEAAKVHGNSEMIASAAKDAQNLEEFQKSAESGGLLFEGDEATEDLTVSGVPMMAPLPLHEGPVGIEMASMYGYGGESDASNTGSEDDASDSDGEEMECMESEESDGEESDDSEGAEDEVSDDTSEAPLMLSSLKRPRVGI